MPASVNHQERWWGKDRENRGSRSCIAQTTWQKGKENFCLGLKKKKKKKKRRTTATGPSILFLCRQNKKSALPWFSLPCLNKKKNLCLCPSSGFEAQMILIFKVPLLDNKGEKANTGPWRRWWASWSIGSEKEKDNWISQIWWTLTDVTAVSVDSGG